MRSPLMQVLDAIVMMDAHDARKVRDMADAHLRDLHEAPHKKGFDEECAACLPSQSACLRCGGDWDDAEHTGGLCQNPIAHLPDESRSEANIQANRELAKRANGAELQRGLEAAVVRERERERLDGPDGDSLPHSGVPGHEGAPNECPACEDEGHVGQTDVAPASDSG